MNKLREDFPFAMSRTSRLWRKLLDDRLSDLGLTQSRWVVLLYLQKLGGGLTQRELADALSIEAPTLVRLVDGLEKSGLIERTSCASDGRAKRVHLTDAGQKFLKTLNGRASRLRRQMLAEVSDEDLETCLKVFNQIRHNAASLGAKVATGDIGIGLLAQKLREPQGKI